MIPNPIDTIALLNAPVITAEGSFDFKIIGLSGAREIVSHGSQSYIGHQSTCDILSQLLGVVVPLNRTQYYQKVGAKALVFKLKTRPPEGVILKTIEEVEEVGYEFGLLIRTK